MEVMECKPPAPPPFYQWRHRGLKQERDLLGWQLCMAGPHTQGAQLCPVSFPTGQDPHPEGAPLQGVSHSHQGVLSDLHRPPLYFPHPPLSLCVLWGKRKWRTKDQPRVSQVCPSLGTSWSAPIWRFWFSGSERDLRTCISKHTR